MCLGNEWSDLRSESLIAILRSQARLTMRGACACDRPRHERADVPAAGGIVHRDAILILHALGIRHQPVIRIQSAAPFSILTVRASPPAATLAVLPSTLRRRVRRAA
jgi:hypothetical protein